MKDRISCERQRKTVMKGAPWKKKQVQTILSATHLSQERFGSKDKCFGIPKPVCFRS